MNSEGQMLRICQAMMAPSPPMRVDWRRERPTALLLSRLACCPIVATLTMAIK